MLTANSLLTPLLSLIPFFTPSASLSLCTRSARSLGSALLASLARPHSLRSHHPPRSLHPRSKGYFWAWIRGTGLRIRPDDPRSLLNAAAGGGGGGGKLGFTHSGVMTKFGVGHSDFMWGCRTLPKMEQLWQTVWAGAHLRGVEDVAAFAENAVQVQLNRGDFLVRDSRVIHANQGVDPRCVNRSVCAVVCSVVCSA